MKTKEQILQSFYTEGADGMPEISAPDLLNAMEAYKGQAVEHAFNAARQLQTGSETHEFATLEDYIQSTITKKEPAKQQPAEYSLDESIAVIANSILPNFLPDDNSVSELSFNFTTQATGYTAFYTKDGQGYWQLKGWELKE